jgi:hypothetical protein
LILFMLDFTTSASIGQIGVQRNRVQLSPASHRRSPRAPFEKRGLNRVIRDVCGAKGLLETRAASLDATGSARWAVALPCRNPESGITSVSVCIRSLGNGTRARE